ncbi:hypothetical protein DFH27DRAFT_109419 [Peziza echinospora]|nr:hypothetical protein DFH27DRAFT_109419 [Peziza echinospora]
MIPPDLKFVSSNQSIPSDISTLDKFDTDRLRVFWKAFKTSRNAMESGARLENLFWRIWGSEKLRTRLSGSRIACIFMMIQQGEEAFERENPKLRIPAFSHRVYRAAAMAAAAMQRPSLDIPPTPPPSPIGPARAVVLPVRPLMLRLPSQSDITASLHQAFPQPCPPPRSSPPGPPRVPPPSPVTPGASPLLSAVQPVQAQPPPITQPQHSTHYRQQAGIRPEILTSNSDNIMNTTNPRVYLPHAGSSSGTRPPPTRSSNSTLSVVDEASATNQNNPRPSLVKKRSTSALSIAESTTSSTTSTKAAKKPAGKMNSKAAKKGKGKFTAGKKGAVSSRPSLARQKSSSATVIEQEEEEEEVEDDDAADDAPLEIKHHHPVREVIPEPVVEVVEEVIEEDKDEGFVDEEVSQPMRRETSAGGLKKGKKKGSSTRLSKKNRNTSANAGTAGLGIAAILGGPGTAKEEPVQTKPLVSIVEPDFRRKFQERNQPLRSALSESKPTIIAEPPVAAESNKKRREKLVFLTNETEARAVKCQATVSTATPSSGTAVARKIQGKNVLLVGTGDMKGLSTVATVGVTAKVGFAIDHQPASGRSPDAGAEGRATAPISSRKSTLSLLIEDARRKDGAKGKGGMKGSASLGSGNAGAL